MRLKHIKLAGFKSFVDATTVPFPDQMTAIVGPNGCGKSNVIDAVRWVLGESSAKNLRGDAMTDVIFNGSSRRKPVSQASVELVFDNTEGRLEGNLADRAEISVKRQVNKDAQSTYFLNGSKCRRRDITDIFLGTGLGPRSYAIIEQGMISRLIESKPQELRVFIEEAAGISKYKERRRETENRIKHTRENLLRLEDVREELGTQLEKLKRQAATAKRYKELKSSERQLKAELYALKWHKYNEQLNLYERERLAKETELEQFIAEQRGGELGMLQLKQQHQTLSDKIQQHQQSSYQCSNQITKLEQQIVYARDNRQKQQEEYDELTQTLTQSKEHIEIEQESLTQIENELEFFEPELELVAEQQVASEEQLQNAELAYETWQRDWEKQQKLSANASQNVQVVKTKIQSHQLQATRLSQQLSDLNREISDIENGAKPAELAGLQVQVENNELALEEIKTRYETELELQQTLESGKQSAEKALMSNSQNLSHLKQQLANLQNWQSEYEQNIAQNAEASLTTQKITNLGSAVAQLQVATEWREAVEVMLSYQGNLLLVDKIPSNEAKGQFVSTNESFSSTSGSIGALISGGNYPSWFNSVGAAKSEMEAKQIIATGQFDSVLVQTGSWVGNNWAFHGFNQAASETGTLRRLEQISDLKPQVAQGTHRNTELQLVAEEANHALTEQSHLVQRLQVQVQQTSEQLSESRLELKLQEQQQLQSEKLLERLQTDVETVVLQQETEQELIWQLQQECELIEAQTIEQSSQLSAIEENKHALVEQLNVAKQQVEIAKDKKHQFALKKQNLDSQSATVKSNLQRALQHLSQLKVKYEQLHQSLSHDEEPTLELQMQLEEFLEQKVVAEELLAETQAELADITIQINELEKGQSGVLAKLDKMRSEIESIKLDSEGARIRAQNMLETLNELQQPLKPVLESMPPEAEENEWSQRLDKVSNNISRLGAINLAAIEEYELQAERKGYLDEQFNDLTGALDTLENAIKKIDRESRAKFKQTFEQVNGDLQVLFPKVFGGGSAYLELTADDMLDTGVTIMARPPGKKNSTIHLLSGGEKALTALSLVFSIFRLNPAPFCMLDEVDAPLDDANVGRFCNLVKEMSETVQFIYISHNKVAMEMATHLTGVTMQEPGVSRLVAVDIQEAVKMAEAS